MHCTLSLRRKQLERFIAVRIVEIGSRLVGEQQLRPVDDRTRQRRRAAPGRG
jgi:hypothetical protein